ncbi:MAG: hypothetical protein HC872_08780 [Gammaproteobacteria bacterium]|nr:hypothetical protein [Gammaproteobacteria bacterium]
MIEAEAAGRGSALRFEIKQIELELQLVLGAEASAGGKVGWGLLSFRADGKLSDENTHKLKMTLNLIDETRKGPIPIAVRANGRARLRGNERQWVICNVSAR